MTLPVGGSPEGHLGAGPPGDGGTPGGDGRVEESGHGEYGPHGEHVHGEGGGGGDGHGEHGEDAQAEHEHRALAGVLTDIHSHLQHLERLIGPEVRAARTVGHFAGPAWKKATEGENRLPVSAALAVAILLQFSLPKHLQLAPRWVIPALELALLVALVIANPKRLNRTSQLLRGTGIFLIALTSLANGWSDGALINGLIAGTEGENAAKLLAAGASIYITNIIVFSLWYWEWDRGGPFARSRGEREYPDFLFPQMVTPEVAPPGWHTTYLDYLYVSFTNATAFSPTDTMPMVLWSKMLMMLQSAIALTTIGLVIARAVNILK